MIKKILEISNPAQLSVKYKQLIIMQDTLSKVPIEDIGILLIAHPAIVITSAVLVSMQENKALVIICDNKFLPLSVTLPLQNSHSLHSKIIQQQIHIGSKKKNKIWQQIIKLKIANQAKCLADNDKSAEYLYALADQVKSYDKNNIEAVAAQYYFKSLFGEHFTRERHAEGINACLNYGYAIVRAAVARAICASGLHPSLGIFHSNQYNSLCLADDIMEPFRPLIDNIVYKLNTNNAYVNVDKDFKSRILNILHVAVRYKENKMPFMVSLHHLLADIKQFLLEDYAQQIEYPHVIK